MNRCTGYLNACEKSELAQRFRAPVNSLEVVGSNPTLTPMWIYKLTGARLTPQ